MNQPNTPENNSVNYLESEAQDSKDLVPLKFAHQEISFILQELYDQGQKSLRQVDIVRAYIEYLKKVEHYEYTYEEKQPNVQRALKKLIKDEKVQKAGRFYYLLHPDNTKEIAEKTLIESVHLKKRDMFTMSISTVVIYPTESTCEVAKKWLTKYLGDSCYGIATLDGFLLIMLKGKKDKLAELRANIKKLAEKIYDKHNK